MSTEQAIAILNRKRALSMDELTLSKRPGLYVEAYVKRSTMKIYGESFFTDENVRATRDFVFQQLALLRKKYNKKDEEPLFFMNKHPQPVQNFRNNYIHGEWSDSYKDVTLYAIPWVELRLPTKTPEYVFMLKQRDLFSCSGASLLACTAGYAKVPPSRVLIANSRLGTTSNEWAIEKKDGSVELTDRDWSPLMHVEGMVTLVYDTLGTLPCIFFGKVAQEGANHSSSLDKEDNIFQGDLFQRLMRMVRFASICCYQSVHWYSLVCVPMGENELDNAYIVLDSMNHDTAQVFNSYTSLYEHWMIPKTRDSYQYPLTVSIYPLLLKQQECDSRAKSLMEKIIEKSLVHMDTEQMPFVTWPLITSCINEIK